MNRESLFSAPVKELKEDNLLCISELSNTYPGKVGTEYFACSFRIRIAGFRPRGREAFVEERNGNTLRNCQGGNSRTDKRCLRPLGTIGEQRQTDDNTLDPPQDNESPECVGEFCRRPVMNGGEGERNPRCGICESDAGPPFTDVESKDMHGTLTHPPRQRAGRPGIFCGRRCSYG